MNKTVADFAIAFLNQLPELLAAGVDMTSAVLEHKRALERMKDEKRDPTSEEWAALNERIANDTRRLQGARTDAVSVERRDAGDR